MKNDQHCPECDALISFKNIIGFEEDEVIVEGIMYIFTCKKCDTTFVTPTRISKKVKKNKKLMKMFQDIKSD